MNAITNGGDKGIFGSLFGLSATARLQVIEETESRIDKSENRVVVAIDSLKSELKSEIRDINHRVDRLKLALITGFVGLFAGHAAIVVWMLGKLTELSL